MTELARELRVSAQKLYWWRRRLREDARASEPRFMEVKVATPAQAKPFGVQTRGGQTIAVWPGFDASELRRLLAAVEALEC
jgi:transposase-like protein